MDSFSKDQETKILSTARNSILNALKRSDFIIPEDWSKDHLLMQKRGTFVTLTIQNQLRGCIGSILPIRPLLVDVKENALHAAFHDPRFAPLQNNEYPGIQIEVSILTVPVQTHFLSVEDLLKNIKPNVDGVIIQSSYHQATFLPQVWEELSNPDQFFNHLCRKAGLPGNYYQTHFSDLTIHLYQATVISE